MLISLINNVMSYIVIKFVFFDFIDAEYDLIANKIRLLYVVSDIFKNNTILRSGSFVSFAREVHIFTFQYCTLLK